MIKKITYIFVPSLLSLALLTGWGGIGHSKISYYSSIFFHSDMAQFASAWRSGLSSHASDADNRKSSDPAESDKHFIDIDDYPEFNSTGKIAQDYSTIVSQHGSSFVQNAGILPWATITAFDSLKNQFRRRDFDRALLTAADLGHYVGDGYMPLHITKNYDGKLTGQSGIHSRYESNMISKYQNSFVFTADTISYISNVSGYVFDYIYTNYKYCDSLFKADQAAYTAASSRSSDAYYLGLWNGTGAFTNRLFNGAAKSLAALIYTAWTDAGKPQLTTAFAEKLTSAIAGFEVYQNYPNPFNPETVITFSLPYGTDVSVSVFDIRGKEINIMKNNNMSAGRHSVRFNASGLPCGIYYYQVSAGKRTITKKMAVIK